MSLISTRGKKVEIETGELVIWGAQEIYTVGHFEVSAQRAGPFGPSAEFFVEVFWLPELLPQVLPRYA